MFRRLFCITTVLALTVTAASAASRFPKPDFESGHTLPETTQPAARSLHFEYLDLVVLVAAMSLASWLALKKRARKWMAALSVFSLVYFGFWRKGCVCPVGSIQNMVLAVSDNSYVVPVFVVLFFALPLLFSLFFGRVFCAAVCPLGAIQDVVAVNPVRIPRWLREALGFIPYTYLGLAILLTATGSAFLVCRYDPFVGFFRLGANFPMLVFGGAMLIVGTVVARPYCRFLCPYSVLLNWTSRLSRRHLSITPGDCIQCRLCENSCPYDVIVKPVSDTATEERGVSLARFRLLLLATPIIVLLFAWLGNVAAGPLSKMHRDVRLAALIAHEDAARKLDMVPETEAFNATGTPRTDLVARVARVRRNFGIGTPILGVFLGLCLAGKLLALSVRRSHHDYVPDRGNCLSCARCIPHCPVERKTWQSNE